MAGRGGNSLVIPRQLATMVSFRCFLTSLLLLAVNASEAAEGGGGGGGAGGSLAGGTSACDIEAAA